MIRQIKKLLPKKLSEGVALNHSVLKISFKFKGLKKLSILIWGGVLSLYFLGYQPTLAIPPIKQNIAKAQLAQKQDILTTELSAPFQLPHPGFLSTKYTPWHPGIDLATGLGMPIRAIAPGKVIEVTHSFWGLGNFVTVEHEQGFKSTYGHMGRIFVKNGDLVLPSSIMGEVGMTGHTSGPHTHLEVTKDLKAIDPLTILPDIPLFH